MQCTRVQFTELHEKAGDFGCERVSVGGSVFPKHLIYSYDLKTKTVVFSSGWYFEVGKWDSRKKCFDFSFYQFKFGDFLHTALRHHYIKKIDFVDVDCDPNEFSPNSELALVTLLVPLRNKARVDKLLQAYRAAKALIAERSRESSLTIAKTRQVRLKQLYELVMQKSEIQGFVEQLRERKLVPKTERFAVTIGSSIFPRQLANFENQHGEKG